MALGAVPLYLELGPRYGAEGLAAAGVIGMSVNAVLTLWLLRRVHGGPPLGELRATLARALLLTLLAAVAAHQAARPAGFRTLEVETGLASALAQQQIRPGSTVLIDCLTLLVSNLIVGDVAGFKARVEAEINALLEFIAGREMNCGPGIPWKKQPASTSPESSINLSVRKRPDQRKGADSLSSNSRNRIPYRSSSSLTRSLFSSSISIGLSDRSGLGSRSQFPANGSTAFRLVNTPRRPARRRRRPESSVIFAPAFT